MLASDVKGSVKRRLTFSRREKAYFSLK